MIRIIQNNANATNMRINDKLILINPSQGLIPRRLRRYAFIIDA